MGDLVNEPSSEGSGDETEAERLRRNWNDLLQEIRVTQTGIQILFGFLLTLPFAAGFERLDAPGRDLYLVIVALVTGSTLCNLTPVIAHRVLFNQGEKATLVAASHRLLKASMNLLGLALAGAVALIVRVVLDNWIIGSVAGVLVLAAVIILWVVLPRRLRD
jgi:hypothetical protein